MSLLVIIALLVEGDSALRDTEVAPTQFLRINLVAAIHHAADPFLGLHNQYLSNRFESKSESSMI